LTVGAQILGGFANAAEAPVTALEYYDMFRS
jgi:hypothetical protein